MGLLDTEIAALTLSAAVEAPVGWALVRLARWESRGAAHVAAACALATAATHPQLWAAAEWAYPRLGYWPSVGALEAAVVVVEGAAIAWIAQLRLQRAMLVSVAANAASLAVGLALTR